MYLFRSDRELTPIERIKLAVGLRCTIITLDSDGNAWTYQLRKEELSPSDTNFVKLYGLRSAYH